MERSYKLLLKAKKDLENIFQYVALDLLNPESALEIIEKFENKFNDICKFPKAYPLTMNSNLDNHHLRKSIVDNFIIIYMMNTKNSLTLLE